MFLHADEETYFRKFLNPSVRLLEWGSGESTLQLVDLVQYVVSIEHDEEWYDKIARQLHDKKNVRYNLFPPATPYSWATNEDGNLSQFGDYVFFPLQCRDYGKVCFPFDVIFIDGRARPYCAELAPVLSHLATQVFIHDYQPDTYPGRKDYTRALKALNFVEQVHDLARFVPKPELVPDLNWKLCQYKPELAHGAIGMFHCPDCGQMVVAGVPHPDPL